MLMALAGMAGGFITISAVERFHVPDSTAGLFTLAMLGGQVVANLAFGLMADRFGHKLPLEIGVLGDWRWRSAIGVAGAIGRMVLRGFRTVRASRMPSVIVSGVMIVMEFSEPARRPTYVGVANTGGRRCRGRRAADRRGAGRVELQRAVRHGDRGFAAVAGDVPLPGARAALAAEDAGHSAPSRICRINGSYAVRSPRERIAA